MRTQRCLVCHEVADTEAPLCRSCVADGCTADDNGITVPLTLNLPDWMTTTDTSPSEERQ